MFEASIPGVKEYTLGSRAACYVVKGLEYALSGMAAGFVGQGVSNALMVARYDAFVCMQHRCQVPSTWMAVFPVSCAHAA